MMEVMLYETVISDSAVIKAALDTPTAATPTSKNAQQATMGESKENSPKVLNLTVVPGGWRGTSCQRVAQSAAETRCCRSRGVQCWLLSG